MISKYPEPVLRSSMEFWQMTKNIPTRVLEEEEEAEFSSDVSEGEPDTSIEFIPWWDILKAGPPIVAGYLAQQIALTAFAIMGLDGIFDPCASIFLFGPPGVGKTNIVKALAFWLNSLGHRVSVLRVNCHELVGKNSAEDVKRLLNEEVDSKVQQSQPLLLDIEEVDAISSDRIVGKLSPAENALRQYCMNKMESRGNGIMIICTTNIIDSVDPAIRQKASGGKIFFDIPLLHDINKILRSLGIQSHQEVSRSLVDIAMKHGVCLTPRNLYRGVNSARKWYAASGNRFDSVAPLDQAKEIFRFGGETHPEEKIRSYRAKYRRDIQDATEHSRFYRDAFDSLVKRGRIKHSMLWGGQPQND